MKLRPAKTLILFLAFQALALTPASALTLRAAQAILIRSNPDLAILKLEVERAEAQAQESRADWFPSVDAVGKRVMGETNHFTTFALIGQTDNDLTSAYVYPNPFRPKLGHRKITLSNLGQNTKIRILTVTGEQVAALEAGSANGKLEWDATNSAGQPVASGVYLSRLESAKHTVTAKMMLIK